MLKFVDKRSPVLAPEMLKVLTKKKAWHPNALEALGLPPERVRQMVVDGRFAREERAFLAVGGRKRTDPTTFYVWGPDIPFYLGLGN